MSTQTTRNGQGSITGRRYSRKPRRAVLFRDALARRLITLSGIGSIVAVSMVGLFLVWVVLPLLMPAQIAEDRPLPTDVGAGGSAFVAGAVDGYGNMSWGMTPQGEIIVRNLADGAVLDRIAVGDSLRPTAWSFGVGTGQAAFGFGDGTVRTAELVWHTTFHADEEVPDRYTDMIVGEARAWDNGVVVRTPEGQLRHQVLELTTSEPIPVGAAPVRLVDLAKGAGGLFVAALDAEHVLHHRKLTMRKNMLTGKVRVTASGGELDLAPILGPAAGSATALKLDDTGNLALLLETDGTVLKLVRDGDEFVDAGRQDLVADPTATLTAAAFLNGRISLVVGDSGGDLTVWFPLRDKVGGVDLVAAHRLEGGSAAVTALGASERSRMLAAGYGDGTVRLFNVTNQRKLGEGRMDGGTITRVAIAPREDQLLVTGQGGEALWRVDAEYGEVSPATFFAPIWYEGYPAPAYVWQSSAGSDSFEPKLSLVPLIFGTLKATFYSLLFGLPLAFLAAIFTSEFLDKGTRARVKPVIEIMASLPSVVLGFLAALVVAPWVEDVVVEVLTVLMLAPLGILVGAHLWQLLPRNVAARWENWRPAAVFVSLAIGALVAWRLAPLVEGLLFAGDFKAWLDGRVGSGLGGWFVLLIVPMGTLAWFLNMRYGDGVIRNLKRGTPPLTVALYDLARFAVVAALTVSATVFVGWLLTSSGWDPRGSVFDTYVQRNALVVGIAMGFAVIPLIYTISEDALVSVPDHLRAASLGAGATPWQTAVRVVIPPAMSGLFSAAMIGLGRAVGETMIVLMAAGNTPIMEWNIFNGFRTLSANLAVELPEAVQNSTHYRTLFLAALTLFVMTFILNTVAEAVRLHFRGKTSRL
ncbi:ABC transporter permease subunit [bacterium]|nr:ABC transporter permease subunit [bacterium]